MKSRINSGELASYVAQLDSFGPYDRMFYVFHSGTAAIDDERVTVIGPDRLAELVVEAGLSGCAVISGSTGAARRRRPAASGTSRCRRAARKATWSKPPTSTSAARLHSAAPRQTAVSIRSLEFPGFYGL